jgi:hypothetical protein
MKTKVYFRIRKCVQAGMLREHYFEFYCKDVQEAKEMAHQELWETFGDNSSPSSKLILKGFTRRGKDFEDELLNIGRHNRNALTFEVDTNGRSTNVISFPGNRGLLCFRAVDNTKESTMSLG